MSRRLLLASGGASSPVVVPEDPDEGLPPTSDGYPVTTDPIVTMLRPTGVRVLATATATPGDFLGDVCADLYAELDSLTETLYGKDGPDHSCILYLPPGTYRGGFATGRWMSIVGLGNSPEDVIIFNDDLDADGVIHPYAPLYLENLTVKAAHNVEADQSPKYCVHIAGSPRTTFANVIFDSTEAAVSVTDPTWSGGATLGMDGGPGVRLVSYKCTFLPSDDTIGMNIHGGGLGNPSKIAFIDCTMPNGLGYQFGVGVDDPDVPDDEVYVIGGTIGGSMLVSKNVAVYTDHDNPVTGGSTSITRNHTTWPEKVDKGLDQFWLDYYYPSNLATTGTIEVKPTVTDTAPMTPVAGRTYYCPIPVTAATWFNRWGIYVRTGAGGTFGWAIRPDKEVTYGSAEFANEPHPDIRFDMTSANVQTLPSGKMLVGYYYSYVAYPATPLGGNRTWFGFKIPTTTGVTIDGSAMLPGLHDCYYSDDNGTTLVKATAGTPFPIAHAAQVR